MCSQSSLLRQTKKELCEDEVNINSLKRTANKVKDSVDSNKRLCISLCLKKFKIVKIHQE